MAYYLVAFAGGLAGSLHCLGMCGGLVGILASASSGRPWRRLALYNGARVNMLVALGLVAGALGTTLAAWGPLGAASRGLAMVAGAVMIVAGLEVLGLVAPRGAGLAARIHAGLARGLRDVLVAPSPWAPLALGSLNAFLPCHLIYAFLAMAAASGSAGRGALTMLAFGLGTVPAMVAPGAARAWIPAGGGGRLARLAGALVVLVGVVTLARGLGPGAGGAAHLHH